MKERKPLLNGSNDFSQRIKKLRDENTLIVFPAELNKPTGSYFFSKERRKKQAYDHLIKSYDEAQKEISNELSRLENEIKSETGNSTEISLKELEQILPVFKKLAQEVKSYTDDINNDHTLTQNCPQVKKIHNSYNELSPLVSHMSLNIKVAISTFLGAVVGLIAGPFVGAVYGGYQAGKAVSGDACFPAAAAIGGAVVGAIAGAVGGVIAGGYFAYQKSRNFFSSPNQNMIDKTAQFSKDVHQHVKLNLG